MSKQQLLKFGGKPVKLEPPEDKKPESDCNSSIDEENDSESIKNDDNEEEKDASLVSKEEENVEELEYDEEGRPKGVSHLLELIKADLGEQQSENFRLFYDLMSNQIRYCLSQYIQDSQETQENNKDSAKQ